MPNTVKKNSKQKPTRKVNAFMKKLNNARKKNLASFKYKGRTYKKQTKEQLVFYKAL